MQRGAGPAAQAAPVQLVLLPAAHQPSRPGGAQRHGAAQGDDVTATGREVEGEVRFPPRSRAARQPLALRFPLPAEGSAALRWRRLWYVMARASEREAGSTSELSALVTATQLTCFTAPNGL